MRKIIVVLVLCGLFLGLVACGNKSTEGLEFTPLEDGTYSVSGYVGDEMNVVIPAKYNDIEVTVIDEEAFAETEIQSISGGKNIVEIKEDAFYGCYLLKSFKIEGDIIKIHDAFSDCANLETIELPKTLEYLGGAFSGCSSLKTIIIPDGVKEIGVGAFSDCTSLEEVVLPDALETISNEAFLNCKNLKKIELPKTLTSIGDKAFGYCDSLSEITIPSSVVSVGTNAFIESNAHLFKEHYRKLSIIVDGKTVGWKSSWCDYSDAEVIYKNKDKSGTDVNIKSGTYLAHSSINNAQLYIDNGCLEFMYKSGALLVGTEYTYEIDGNVLYCMPKIDDQVIVEMIYDEKTESITWEHGWETYQFYWSSSEKTDHPIYYSSH